MGVPYTSKGELNLTNLQGWKSLTKQPSQLPPLFNILFYYLQPEWEEINNRTVDTFVLLLYYFSFRDFWTLLGYLFKLFFRYSGYKDTINFRYWVKIGLSSNLQGCIVPGTLPVPCVIQHGSQTAATSIVSHETRSCIEIDNTHYLVIYLRTTYVALQYPETICTTIGTPWSSSPCLGIRGGWGVGEGSLPWSSVSGRGLLVSTLSHKTDLSSVFWVVVVYETPWGVPFPGTNTWSQAIRDCTSSWGSAVRLRPLNPCYSSSSPPESTGDGLLLPSFIISSICTA